MKILTLALLISLICISPSFSKETSNFDFILVLTQQDTQLDWWEDIPSGFGPTISKVKSVSKGEFFNILPIFNNYGATPENIVKITYDMTIYGPDNSVDDQVLNCVGYKGEFPGPYLIPSSAVLQACFDLDDAYGEYTIEVIAYDHVKDQKVKKTEIITLQKFILPEITEDDNEFFFSYPTSPKPAEVLASFLIYNEPSYDDNFNPNLSTLWFYKIVFENNDYLIPHTIDFFNSTASEQQKKNIILLFSILNITDTLNLNGNLKQFSKIFANLTIPDLYSEIHSGTQLDMLWSEYFATSRIKPVRHIITAFNLSKYEGTLDKIKNKELDVDSYDVKRRAFLEALFGAAAWALESNCKQSKLLLYYCIGLYQSDQLNETEKTYLKVILQRIINESKDNKELETSGK